LSHKEPKHRIFAVRAENRVMGCGTRPSDVAGFSTPVLARAAKANKRRLRLLEEYKRKELQRTPLAILDETPARIIR